MLRMLQISRRYVELSGAGIVTTILASSFQIDLRDESDGDEFDEATKIKHKSSIDDILRTVGQSVHRSEAESFLLT